MRARTRLLTLASLGFLSLALVLPANAAVTTELVRYKGLTAQAYFSSTEGCIETIVYVHASDGTVKVEPGGPEAASGGDVSLFQNDVCTGTALRSAYGRAQLAPDQFRINDEFTTASLAALTQPVRHARFASSSSCRRPRLMQPSLARDRHCHGHSRIVLGRP